MDFGNGLENNFHHSKILYTQNFYDILLHVNGLIAQLVEQLTLNPQNTLLNPYNNNHFE